MKSIIGTLVGLLIIVGIGLGVWFFWRSVHYKIAYESMVQETVREMVKPEALK